MLRSHGRKSQHSAMVSGVQDLNWPPPAPENINEHAQREWRDVTSNLTAADMPRASFPLLGVWCCLKVELDDVMLSLAQLQDVPTSSEDLKRYKVLLSMRTSLTREFAQLSTKLRLTPAARLDAHRPQSGINSNKPWTSANKQKANDQDGQLEFSQLSSKLDAQPRNGNPWGEGEVPSEEEQ